MLYNGGIYRALLVGHIMMVIIGFGAVFLGGVYGNLAKKRQGREGQAIAEAAYHVAGEVGEKFIMAVPVFGVLLVLASHKAAKFSQTWVWLALILFAIAFGVAQAVHMPNLRRMNALMGELNAMQPAPAGPRVVDIEKLKDNLYVLTSSTPGNAATFSGGNVAVFITESGVTLVDTKLAGWGQAVLDKVKSVTNKPVTRIINTHTHGDHTGNNNFFGTSVEISAGEHEE